MFGRGLVLAYGVGAYALFFGVFLYTCGFVGNFGTPTSLDGPRDGSLSGALATDLALVALFALQHSGMARPGFKRWLTRAVHPAAERSTYVLASSLALGLLFAFWQPLGGTVWDAPDPLRPVFYAAFVLGWLIVFVTTFMLNHFDLFGLRQVWLHFRGRAYEPLPFGTPGLYKYVRHPLYVGWLLAFWATPTMTLSHLVFAGALTAYILAAIVWEERDLVAAHPEYAEYRERVGMLVPRLPARGTPADAPARSVQ